MIHAVGRSVSCGIFVSFFYKTAGTYFLAAFLFSIIKHKKQMDQIFLEGGDLYIMTLHILFFTITIKRRKFTIDEMLREQEVNEIMEQHKDRQFSRYNHF